MKLNGAKFRLDEYGKYEELNYHILDSMADWVRVVDRNGLVIYANRPMLTSLGNDMLYTKCHVDCKNHEISNFPCFCTVEESIEKGHIMQKEGFIGDKIYSIKSSPVYGEEGDILAAVEVFRDVTREKSLEEKLKLREDKVNRELGLAKRIQNTILPDSGEVDGIFMDYIYQPSEVLSGDMFDIFKVDEDNVGIYVSDVAGHGISASMITMFVRQSMRFIKDDILSPSKALSELYNRFRQLNLSTTEYFTIFYGVFNKKTQEFRYSNAGHNCIPIRYNDEGYDLLKLSGYPIFNIFDRVNYKEEKIRLNPGDNVLLYTDGITERKNSRGEEFGLDKLIKLIENSEGDILNEVESKISKYGKHEDDFAMVMMKILDS